LYKFVSKKFGVGAEMLSRLKYCHSNLHPGEAKMALLRALINSMFKQAARVYH